MEETSGIKSQGKFVPQNNPKPCIHSTAFAPGGGQRTVEDSGSCLQDHSPRLDGTGLFPNNYRSGFCFNSCRELLWDQISTCATHPHMASHLENANCQDMSAMKGNTKVCLLNVVFSL